VYPLYYKGGLAGAYVADLVVDGKIIPELKSVKALGSAMEAQLINYLRLSGVPVGYLINNIIHLNISDVLPRVYCWGCVFSFIRRQFAIGHRARLQQHRCAQCQCPIQAFSHFPSPIIWVERKNQKGLFLYIMAK
jgi:hypothetical protein